MQDKKGPRFIMSLYAILRAYVLSIIHSQSQALIEKNNINSNELYIYIYVNIFYQPRRKKSFCKMKIEYAYIIAVICVYTKGYLTS